MSLVLNGSGTITGLSAGGLPSATINQTNLNTNVAGNGPAFSAYANTGQTVANNTYTKVSLQVEDFDTNNNFDSTTNYRFTPTVAGYYQINGGVTFTGLTINVATATIYKNGTAYANGQGASTTNGLTAVVGAVIYLNGSTDYVELYTFQNNATSGTTYAASRAYNYFSGSMVRAA
jgi:hypothetical protein